MPEVSWRHDPVLPAREAAAPVLREAGRAGEDEAGRSAGSGPVAGPPVVAVSELREDPPIPSFCGKPVDAARVRMTSATVDSTDVHDIDDVVQVTFEGRVTSVDHRVNEQTGELVRVHTIKVLEVEHVQRLVAPGMTVVR